VLLDLLGLRGAGDHARHEGLAGEPADRHVEYAAPTRLGERLDAPEHLEVLGRQYAVRHAAGASEPRALGRRFARSILAGKEAACEREVWEHAEAVLLRDLHKIALDPSFEQAVLVLRRRERRQVLRLRDPLRLDNLPCGEVGAADVARLPRPDDVVERAHGLFDWRA